MFGAIANRLRCVNAHSMGVFGLLLGGAAIVVPPVTAFFALLSNPTYLVDLAHALSHAYWAYRLHKPLPDDDLLTLMKLVGATIAICGGFTVALLCAFYGNAKPTNQTVGAAAGQKETLCS